MLENSSSPKSPSAENQSPKKWLHPKEIMTIQRLKRRKRALTARMNCSQILSQTDSQSTCDRVATTSLAKRHNPFIKTENVTKSQKQSEEQLSPAPAIELDTSIDQTIFEIFGTKNGSSSTGSPKITTFSNVLNRIGTQNYKKTGDKHIPVDWSLKTKARIMSVKPLQWSKKRKTVEEASAITSFVRCLDHNAKTSPNMDSSPNTKLGQHSMYWQHPNIPWLSLFPRHNKKTTDSTNTLPNLNAVKQSLHQEWIDSIKSLFQLMRARQCPYFYVCSNTFTVLFRAAGIGGFSDLHAILTPSTKGFRQILRQEKIGFKMPLLVQKKRLSNTNSTDHGYDSLSQDSSKLKLSESSSSMFPEIDEDSQNAEWLQSLGINEEHIKRIQNEQTKVDQKSEHDVDNSEQSLVLIDGTEINGFLNLLINCKSIIASTGPFAGIPPTLLAPVAFVNGSLKSLKVEDCIVSMNTSKYFSTEFCGPILPSFMHNMCDILPKTHNFTITAADLASTLPLAKMHSTIIEENSTEKSENGTSYEIFSQENLTDCGVNVEFVKNSCSLNPNFTKHYDSIKFDKDSNTFIVY